MNSLKNLIKNIRAPQLRALLLTFIILLNVQATSPKFEFRDGPTEPPDSNLYRLKVSSGISSDLDKYLGLYNYSLPSNLSSNKVVGIAVSKDDIVYTWYINGTYSKGSSNNLKRYSAPKPFSLPSGRHARDIVAVGIASTNRVYYWYRNGTVSAGTPADADKYFAPKKCSFAPSLSARKLVAAGITGSNDHVYYWFNDRTVSSGTSTDTDRYKVPYYYTLAPGKSPDDIIGGGIAGSDDHTYMWYHGRAIGEGHPTVEKQIDQLVFDLLDDSKIPGLTVAVTKRGHLIHNKGYGFANFKTKRHMQAYHRTYIGSISKIFTTIGFLKLAEKRSDLSPESKLYASGGKLSHIDYSLARSKGMARHNPIISMAIASSNDHVYTWYADGKVSEGSSTDLDEYSKKKKFSLPPGKKPHDIRAVAISSKDRVYTWYDDWTVSIGTSKDLDKYAAPKEFSGLKPRRVGNIVGIGISSKDRVYTWFDDGKFICGSSVDLDKYSSPKSYSMSSGKKPYDIRAMGIAKSNDRVYTWHHEIGYSHPSVSTGSSKDLDRYKKGVSYKVFSPNSAWAQYYVDMKMKHLLSHTAGFTDSGDTSGASKMFDTKLESISYKQVHLYHLRTRKLLFKPGSEYSYSNHGMGLISHIISIITKKPFHKYMTEEVLKPMGLHRVIPRNTKVEKYDSWQHITKKEKIIVLDKKKVDYVSTGLGAGGWVATARDLARMMVSTDKLSNHNDILKPATLDLMEKRPFPNVEKSHALGWKVYCKTGDCSQRILSHSGRTPKGGNAYIKKFSSRYISNDNIKLGKINVAICSNTGHNYTNELNKLANEIAKVVGKAKIVTNYDLF